MLLDELLYAVNRSFKEKQLDNTETIDETEIKNSNFHPDIIRDGFNDHLFEYDTNIERDDKIINNKNLNLDINTKDDFNKSNYNTDIIRQKQDLDSNYKFDIERDDNLNHIDDLNIDNIIDDINPIDTNYSLDNEDVLKDSKIISDYSLDNNYNKDEIENKIDLTEREIIDNPNKPQDIQERIIQDTDKLANDLTDRIIKDSNSKEVKLNEREILDKPLEPNDISNYDGLDNNLLQTDYDLSNSEYVTDYTNDINLSEKKDKYDPYNNQQDLDFINESEINSDTNPINNLNISEKDVDTEWLRTKLGRLFNVRIDKDTFTWENIKNEFTNSVKSISNNLLTKVTTGSIEKMNQIAEEATFKAYVKLINKPNLNRLLTLNFKKRPVSILSENEDTDDGYPKLMFEKQIFNMRNDVEYDIQQQNLEVTNINDLYENEIEDNNYPWIYGEKIQEFYKNGLSEQILHWDIKIGYYLNSKYRSLLPEIPNMIFSSFSLDGEEINTKTFKAGDFQLTTNFDRKFPKDLTLTVFDNYQRDIEQYFYTYNRRIAQYNDNNGQISLMPYDQTAWTVKILFYENSSFYRCIKVVDYVVIPNLKIDRYKSSEDKKSEQLTINCNIVGIGQSTNKHGKPHITLPGQAGTGWLNIYKHENMKDKNNSTTKKIDIENIKDDLEERIKLEERRYKLVDTNDSSNAGQMYSNDGIMVPNSTMAIT